MTANPVGAATEIVGADEYPEPPETAMLVITPFVIVGVTVTPAELPPPPEIDTTGVEE